MEYRSFYCQTCGATKSNKDKDNPDGDWGSLQFVAMLKHPFGHLSYAENYIQFRMADTEGQVCSSSNGHLVTCASKVSEFFQCASENDDKRE